MVAHRLGTHHVWKQGTARTCRCLSYLALALVMALLGSCVRLSDAGSPAWVVCCAHIRPGDTSARTSQIDVRYLDHLSEAGKATSQGGHRVATGMSGLLVLALVAISLWRGRHQALLTVLAGLVLFQALLSMGPVAMKLMPLVVTASLIGGMSLLVLLSVLLLKRYRKRVKAGPPPGHFATSIMRVFADIGLMLSLITLNHRLNFPLVESPARVSMGELS